MGYDSYVISFDILSYHICSTNERHFFFRIYSLKLSIDQIPSGTVHSKVVSLHLYTIFGFSLHNLRSLSPLCVLFSLRKRRRKWRQSVLWASRPRKSRLKDEVQTLVGYLILLFIQAFVEQIKTNTIFCCHSLTEQVVLIFIDLIS